MLLNPAESVKGLILTGLGKPKLSLSIFREPRVMKRTSVCGSPAGASRTQSGKRRPDPVETALAAEKGRLPKLLLLRL